MTDADADARRYDDTLHRAIRKNYNLVKVSDRRWQVIRILSVAETAFQFTDVVTFELVGKPLPFSEALTELGQWRTR